MCSAVSETEAHQLMESTRLHCRMKLIHVGFRCGYSYSVITERLNFERPPACLLIVCTVFVCSFVSVQSKGLQQIAS
jgi:hypothetical protein